MDSDPEVTLALLAVRLLGGRAEPGAAPLKTLRKAVARAREHNLLAVETVSAPADAAADGRPKRRRAKVVRLTEEGERRLQAGDPAALAATQAAHLEAVRRGLEADRAALRGEVMSILRNLKPQHSEKVARALEGVAKKLDEVTALLTARPEPEAPSAIDRELLTRVEDGFHALLERLGHPAEPAPRPQAAREAAAEPALS